MKNRFYFGCRRQGDFWSARWRSLSLSPPSLVCVYVGGGGTDRFIYRSPDIFYCWSTRCVSHEWEPSAGVTTIVTLCCVIITRWERCQGALAGKRERTEGKEAGRGTTIRSARKRTVRAQRVLLKGTIYTVSRVFLFFIRESFEHFSINLSLTLWCRTKWKHFQFACKIQ